MSPRSIRRTGLFTLARALVLGALGALPAFDSEPRAGTLPAGFAESVAVSGLNMPMSFDFTPDGAIIFGEKEGAVRIWRDGTLHLAGQLSVEVLDESGINGLAVDPDYATNHHLWIMRTLPGILDLRLSRFTVVGDTLTDEQVVMQFWSASTIHHAGCIRFDAAGRLYVTTGDDDRQSAASQNPFDLHGKMLRINRDGTVPADNPFFDGVQADPRVYALGLRHPYRFSFEPGTGNLFIADISGAGAEELNLGIPGANYGWRLVEGNVPPGVPGMVYPVYSYEHSGALGNSIIGGEHARPGDFAPEFEGDYFYGDEAAQQLRHLVLGPSQEVLLDEVFETGAAHPVEIRFGPDGALYYLAFFDGTLQRVAFVGGANRAPTAVGRAIPPSGLAPLSVLLSGSQSSDPDQDPLSYLWDAGQGGITGTNVGLLHVYPAGVWKAFLTVNDGHGGTDKTMPIRVVSGNRAPTGTISAPLDESTFDAGDVLVFGGSGTDPENGALPCAGLSWTVTLHHLGHSHPRLGPIQGVCGGNYTIPVAGETSAQVYYEVRLDVQDDGAPLGPEAILTSTRTVQVRPNLADFTLASAPNPGLTLTLDDVPAPAPKTTTGVVNIQRTLGAPSPQSAADGHTYQFASWSDGGAATHVISTPAGPTTYTAQFTCDVIAEVPNLQVVPAAGGQLTLTWDPIADLCAAAGPTRYQVYASATARPASPPGLFPADPGFVLRGSTGSTSLTFLPDPADRFFLVVATGTDGATGPSGHYGN